MEKIKLFFLAITVTLRTSCEIKSSIAYSIAVVLAILCAIKVGGALVPRCCMWCRIACGVGLTLRYRYPRVPQAQTCKSEIPTIIHSASRLSRIFRQPLSTIQSLMMQSWELHRCSRSLSRLLSVVHELCCVFEPQLNGFLSKAK